jgi:Tfp pilus assembly protein PilF
MDQQLISAAMRLHQQGQFKRAKEIYESILQQHPHNVDVLNALGMLLHQTGRPDESISLLRKAAHLGRNLAHIQLNLGEALRASKLYKEAALSMRRALNLRPNYPEAWFCLGSLKHDLGILDEAITLYRKVIQVMPKLEAAYVALGVALQESGQVDEAINVLSSVIQLYPNSANAQLTLGNIFYQQNDTYRAENCYRRYEKIAPDNDWVNLRIVEILLDKEFANSQEIEHRIQRSETHDQNSPHLLSIKAHRAIQQGNTSAGRDLLMQANSLLPSPGLLLEYSRITKFSALDSWMMNAIHYSWPSMENLHADDRSSLHFALGKMFDDIHEYDQAIKHFMQGNADMCEILKYDRNSVDLLTSQIKTCFTHSFFQDRLDYGSDSDQLVFIVGMPRSGTTLVEQILSSHPRVKGGGELTGISGIKRVLESRHSNGNSCLDVLPSLPAHLIRKLADEYLLEINSIFNEGHARIIDKMPHNFMNIGLISLLFPNAKIIHIYRDPIDNCLSLFMQKFAMGHTYSYDLESLAHQYNVYRDLMKHWRDVLPGRIFELSYEDLVSDSKSWIKNIMESVELDWDDACLTPYKTKRDVKTASLWQVRQPIHKKSVSRWKNYEKHIQPLINALELNNK